MNLDRPIKRQNLRVDTVICNIDPQRAAKMIGDRKILLRLCAANSTMNIRHRTIWSTVWSKISTSATMDLGSGICSIPDMTDLNEAFAQMYDRHDYSNPSFAITTPTR